MSLEDSLRAISKRNQQVRAAFQKMSARITEITLSGTVEELDEFNNGLEAELAQILDPEGTNQPAGSPDGSGAAESDSSGEPPQQ